MIVTMLGEIFPNEAVDAICKGGPPERITYMVEDILERASLAAVIPGDINLALGRLRVFVNKLRTSRLSQVVDAQACADAKKVVDYLTPKLTDASLPTSPPAPQCAPCGAGTKCRRWWPWVAIGAAAAAVVAGGVAAATWPRR